MSEVLLRMTNFIAGVSLVAATLSSVVACAQSNQGGIPGQTADSAAAHAFVQGFYDWYMPLTLRPHNYRVSWEVLSRGEKFLDTPLAQLLREDSLALVSNGSRETLNFDPYLESQDACPRYRVSAVRSVGTALQVTVRPVCPTPDAQMNQDVAPIVEIVKRRGGWKIANVYFKTGDLTGMLCGFAAADLRPEARPTKCPP
jgi:hypothetical protein